MKKYSVLLLLYSLCFLSLNAQDVRYVTANLNLRMEPNTQSSIITVLPKGTAIIIDEDCDCKWIPVRYSGYIGYVSTKYLSKFKANASVLPTSKVRYYTNSAGERVQSPTHYSSVPAGATALCRDGTYSFSRSRRGTCSHHGGVARWLR
jgi:uncharacterized protein YraI